jgi:hypothetical protein
LNRRRGFAAGVLSATVLAIAGCSGSSEPSAHTPETLLDALRSEPDYGLECEDYEQGSLGILCVSSGQGTFDRMTTVLAFISALDFDGTLKAYQETHESRCSEDTETYESAVDGSLQEYVPYESTSESFLVIGKNWATMPIQKELDAQAVADVTGGLLVSGKDWCANPRPLVDFGK